MVSTYEYISLANFEEYMGMDFSAIDSEWTDAVVESWITSSERKINSITGTTFTGTIPDNIKEATMLLTETTAHNKMVEKKYLADKEAKIRPLLNDDIMILLKPYIQTYSNEVGIFVVKH